ncbi:MAG: TIGR01777 family oxidoreductase [Chloroflexota bacterium]
MKVLVAGATGFIGRALVRALLERGDTVIALTRNEQSATRALGGAVETVAWDPHQRGPWMDAFRAADGVVNLAGSTVASPTRPWTVAEKQKIRASRLDATAAIVEAIAGADPKPRVLVNVSAIGYYGSPGSTPVTESSPPGSDFLARVCIDWEAAARRVETMGVRLVVCRTGLVLGKEGGLLPQLVLPFRLFAGGTMGNPDQWVSWIHIEDEIGLLLVALDDDTVTGPLNLTAPNPVTMDVFSRQIGQTIGRPSWVPFIGTAMKIGLGERTTATLASQRVLSEVPQRNAYRFRHTDSAEALRSILAAGK